MLVYLYEMAYVWESVVDFMGMNSNFMGVNGELQGSQGGILGKKWWTSWESVVNMGVNDGLHGSQDGLLGGNNGLHGSQKKTSSESIVDFLGVVSKSQI